MYVKYKLKKKHKITDTLTNKYTPAHIYTNCVWNKEYKEIETQIYTNIYCHRKTHTYMHKGAHTHTHTH